MKSRVSGRTLCFFEIHLLLKNKTACPNGQTVYFGAGDEARTRYLHLGKVALYQMSYTRDNEKYFTTYFVVVNP